MGSIYLTLMDNGTELDVLELCQVECYLKESSQIDYELAFPFRVPGFQLFSS